MADAEAMLIRKLNVAALGEAATLESVYRAEAPTMPAGPGMPDRRNWRRARFAVRAGREHLDDHHRRPAGPGPCAAWRPARSGGTARAPAAVTQLKLQPPCAAGVDQVAVADPFGCWACRRVWRSWSSSSGWRSCPSRRSPRWLSTWTRRSRRSATDRWTLARTQWDFGSPPATAPTQRPLLTHAAPPAILRGEDLTHPQNR
jgi:hypothetical protein